MASSFRDFTSFVELPEVAILLVDYDELTELSRHVIYHHVKGAGGAKDFAYIIELASWIDVGDYFNTALTNYVPAYYIGGAAKPEAKGKWRLRAVHRIAEAVRLPPSAPLLRSVKGGDESM